MSAHAKCVSASTDGRSAGRCTANPATGPVIARWAGSAMMSADVYAAIFWSAVINLTLWTLVCAMFFGYFKMPIYHPISIYLVYHFLGFVLRPISVYAEERSFIWSRIGFIPAVDDIVAITIIANLALLACVLGALWGLKGRSKILMIPPTTFVVTRPRRFALVASVLLALGLFSVYRAYGSAGLDSVNGFEVASDATGGQQLQGISGYTLALAETLPILCIILLLARVPRSIAFGVTGLFVVLRVYIGAQRLSLVVVMAVAFFGVLIAQRRRFPTVTVVVALLVSAVLFDVVGHDRYVLRRVFAGQAGVSELFEKYVEDRTSDDSKAMDVVEYESAAAAVSVVQNYSGYSYGTQYLRMFIWPIPRQIWKDKPVLTNSINLNAYRFNFQHLTYSLYGDLFMALGYPVVFFGMFLLGWAMVRVYQMARTTTKPFGYAFFWIFLIYLQTMLRDGGATFVYFWGFSSIFAFALIAGGRLRLVRADAARHTPPAAESVNPALPGVPREQTRSIG
jgi:hypothetical protein